MLGIDSLFSLVEVIMYALTDGASPRNATVGVAADGPGRRRLTAIPRRRAVSRAAERHRSLVSAGLCVFFFLISLIFATDGGYWLVDIVDHYIVGYTVVFVGALECIALSLLYGLRRFNSDLKRRTGQENWRVWMYSIWVFIPAVLLSLFVYNIYLESTGKVSQSISAQPGWSVGVFGWLFCVVVPFVFMMPAGLPFPWAPESDGHEKGVMIGMTSLRAVSSLTDRDAPAPEGGPAAEAVEGV